ncbi:hypothetical protein FSC37_09280 [Piscinibacter aquaticus]|uniref:Uncharacterized protein n=1 Tax=Piscinibacter aquaticus TaxID=392597 RepID=A0A5C6U0H8_9BURK|nr:hypothetical protein FSC37_09280 [Piscinibacter aquaticus]
MSWLSCQRLWVDCRIRKARQRIPRRCPRRTIAARLSRVERSGHGARRRSKERPVFQLSLTEIAFTIIFILLLLLGYLIVKEQAARQAAEAALAEAGGAARAAAALAGAKTELETALKAGGAKDPEALINRVIDADREREQRETLAKKVADLEAELTALTALKSLLEGTGEAARMQVAKDEVITALTLLKAVRDELQKEPELTAESPVSPASAATAPRAPAPGAVAGQGGASGTKPSTKVAERQPTTPQKPPPDARAAADRVRQALKTDAAFREHAKKHLNVRVKPGEEGQAVEQVVQAAKVAASLGGRNIDALQKEVDGLRGGGVPEESAGCQRRT